MVGICQVTKSHHNHRGQKPTMVGFCHGGNVPISHDDNGDEYDDGDNMIMMMRVMIVLTKGSIISSMARHPSVCSPSVSKIIVPPFEKDWNRWDVLDGCREDDTRAGLARPPPRHIFC